MTWWMTWWIQVGLDGTIKIQDWVIENMALETLRFMRDIFVNVCNTVGTGKVIATILLFIALIRLKNWVKRDKIRSEERERARIRKEEMER